MITLQRAIMAARNAADGVWTLIGPSGFTWLDALGVRVDVLAQFVAANPAGTAEQLYKFAVADHPDAATWARIPRELRVCIEVFRATFLMMLVLHDADRKQIEAKRERERAAKPLHTVGAIPFLEPKGRKYPRRNPGAGGQA